MINVNILSLTGRVKEYEENQYGFNIVLKSGMNEIPLKINKTNINLMEKARKFIKNDSEIYVQCTVKTFASKNTQIKKHFVVILIDRLITDMSQENNEKPSSKDNIDFLI